MFKSLHEVSQCLTCNLHVLLCTSDNLQVAYSECSNTHSSNYSVITKPGSIQTSGGGGGGGKQRLWEANPSVHAKSVSFLPLSYTPKTSDIGAAEMAQ